MTTEEELLAIIASGESLHIEFKESKVLSDTEKLAKSMVAMANAGGGRIFIGITDDGKIEGISPKTQHMEYITNVARDICEPPIAPSFESIHTLEGEVYEVTIPSMSESLPHAVKYLGGLIYYTRLDSRTVSPSALEIQKMFRPKYGAYEVDILTLDIPMQIMKRIASAVRISQLGISSPWFTELALPGFNELLRDHVGKADFNILTRRPADPEHLKQLKWFREKCNAKVFLNDNLHAKLYVMNAETGSFAILGSPNLTRKARTNIELAVIIYNQRMIDKLFNIFHTHLKPLCSYWEG